MTATPHLALARSIAPEVLELVPVAECPARKLRPEESLERWSHSRPKPSIHLCVLEVEPTHDDVDRLGWEWNTECPWEPGSTYRSLDGQVSGDVVLMWVPSAWSWKLVWSERSGRVIAAAYADDREELVAWWERGRQVVVTTQG